jgi:4-amino-4-deoxy-L-arabinose transferase-like glycosyltransferase
MSSQSANNQTPYTSEQQSPALPGAPAGMSGPMAEERRSQGHAALALAAFALALLGQFYFKNLRYLIDGFVFFGAAILLLVILAASRDPKEAPAAERTGVSWFQRLVDRARAEPIRAGLVVASVLLSYTAVRLLKAPTGPGSYWSIFAVWVVGILCFVLAFVHRPKLDLRDWWRRYRAEALAVGALTAVALVLRLVALGKVPNIVSGDEGRIGLLGLSVLKGELTNMMATTFGHSTLYLFIIAGFMRLAGIGPLGLRLTSALGGGLTVLSLYILARYLFNVRVAVVAAALLTVVHIHLHFSRIIVAGGIQDALFATVAFYFLISGLEKRSTTRLLLSALVIGLHVYIYMGARLIIMFVPVYFLVVLVTNPKLIRDNVRNLVIMAVVLLIVIAPMIVWFTAHPADFMARANQVGVFQSGWLANETQNLGQSKQHILGNLLAQAFLTVNYYPATGFYNSPLPMLDFLSGAMFMLGMGYSLYRVLRPGGPPDVPTRERHLLLQGWFWSGVVVGGALVVLPAIAAYRILIVVPAVCIFVGLGLDRLLEFGISDTSLGRLLKNLLTVAFIIIVSLFNLRAYFVDYGPSCLYEDWGTRFASYMGEALGKAGLEYKAYLLGYPRIWYGIHPSVDYLSGGNPITDIKDPLSGPPTFVEPGSKAIFFFTPEREGEMAAVMAYLPGGTVRHIYDCDVLMMTIYQVGAADGGG